MSTRRELYVQLRDAAGNERGLNIDSNGAIAVTDGGSAITVDGTVAISGTVTVDGSGVTQPISHAALTELASAIDTEVQCDIVGALPAGTNAIGKLAANSGVDIGDVDVTTVTPGTGAGNLGKAEDAAHTTGDVGVMVLAVRQDSDASFAGTSGDYAPLQLDDNGFLKVNIKAGAGSGGTASTDDGAFTAGSGSGTPAMGFFSADTVDAGDVGVLAMDANRRLMVSIEADNVGIGGGTQYTEDAAAAANPVGNALIMVRDDSLSGQTTADGDNIAARGTDKGELYVKHVDAIPVTDNSGSLTVDGTVSVSGTVTVDGSGVTQPVSHAALTELAAAIDTELQVDVVAALPAGTNNIGDVDIASIAAGDNNIGNVDVVTMPNVTLAAGTNTNEVVGDAAHDAAIAGNPVRLAGRALTADYTAVAAGDTADIITTLLGKQVVYPYANPNQSWKYAAASGGITNTTGVTIKAAAGAGVKNYLTDLQIINGHASTSTDVQIRDGASGTVVWRGWAQAAGGGISIHFSTPIPSTANTLFEVACGTTGAAVYVNAQGFTAAE
jgi:hypothetical protein